MLEFGTCCTFFCWGIFFARSRKVSLEVKKAVFLEMLVNFVGKSSFQTKIQQKVRGGMCPQQTSCTDVLRKILRPLSKVFACRGFSYREFPLQRIFLYSLEHTSFLFWLRPLAVLRIVVVLFLRSTPFGRLSRSSRRCFEGGLCCSF